MKRKRIYKTVTWRVLATSITMTIVFLLTKRWELSLIGGATESLLKMGAYYVHEKAWGD